MPSNALPAPTGTPVHTTHPALMLLDQWAPEGFSIDAELTHEDGRPRLTLHLVAGGPWHADAAFTDLAHDILRDGIAR